MTPSAFRGDDGRRQRTRRAFALGFTVPLSLAVALWTGAAAAQAADDGMIVIPGRGETAESALAHANAASGARPGADGSAGVTPDSANAGRAAAAYMTARTNAAYGAPRAADSNGIVTVVTGATEPASSPARPPQQPALAARTPAQRAGSAATALRAPASPAATANATTAPVAPPPGQQDPESIRRTALAFLQQQIAGLPGKPTATVSTAFPRGLAACTTLEPFLPTGARLWGRTTVGVRCAGERPWTVYLQAKVTVQATYYVAARQIAPGEPLTAADLVARDGDLTVLPLAVITDPAQAIGATALARVAAGLPLRQDMLKSAASVSAGQTVRVVAAGRGFTISAEGSALANAAPGQSVRVRMAAGQIVTAIVKDAGTVEIPL
ncbi:flagellar basal body P-ring formation protein FlgA [Burkholderia sp. Bp8963]|uniref:flagellar basal body P-ring formation chaperone FlgA n=1 Tax=Burkholderia sp. Bp8963 TaxID=2184547 RepID=UPI000F59D537|nr:flagellar basal body P-ring formation chaperone FlgA [Burkholderia sp. Bp8963]RQS64211.1 flagellar basal body P-ring formation protein FlgA [Burkholderia sp. Bp8963]